jgi:hypothetical protein
MRKGLSYSNVVATIALLIALGGGAYAAVTLPKNSVKSKQIKNKTIKSKDLKKKSVGLGQLKADAVDGSKVDDDSLKGVDIDESSLDVANADNAANADRVGGSQVQQISYSAGPNTGPVEIISVAGLTVTASCPAASDDYVSLTAETDTDNSIISLPTEVNPGGGPGTGIVGTQNDFDSGAPITIPIDDTTTSMAYGRGNAASPVATATFLANQFSGGGLVGTCKVVGTVVTDG